MKLAWMGRYREFVEALIHYCNIYAGTYRTDKMEYQGIRYSYSKIQVLEYLLESEESGENMSAIAARLGITRSCFSKTVTRLAEDGLVEKIPRPGSKKEVLVRVLPLGRALYEDYAERIYQWHFLPMFEEMRDMPQDMIGEFSRALNASLRQSAYAREIEGEE